MSRLKRFFVTGLIVVAPVYATVYVLIVLFRLVDNILGVYLNTYLQKLWGFYIPGLGFFIFIFIIISIGFLATRLIGFKIFPRLEKRFSSLPLIKNIYPALKQLILFVLEQKEFGFKKVVLIEYPSKGIWSVGFLTNEQYQKINQIFDKEMVSVFVPNSPGPFTGYVIFVPKEELKFLDISVIDACKIIISGGVFKPEDAIN
jgi:uncharacterized membrane protein